jgi:cell cycle checkpoint control protein RAD9A
MILFYVLGSSANLSPLKPVAIGSVINNLRNNLYLCLSQLSLTALNSSKSAYASFSLDSRVFFSKYHFEISSPSNHARSTSLNGRFTCQLYNKVRSQYLIGDHRLMPSEALLSVFKGRLLDARDKDAAIERCEVSIEERADKTECRLMVRMICRYGR